MTKIIIDEEVARFVMDAIDSFFAAPDDEADQEAQEKLLTARSKLRKALSDAALDKMVDNARELGLTYDASVVRIDTSPERVEKEAANKHIAAPAQDHHFAGGGKPMLEQPAQAQEPCGWQFFQDGKWYNGMDTNDHRSHTEAAGFPTRDVYPLPPPAQPLTDEQKQKIHNETGANHSLICLVENHIIGAAHGIGEKK